MKRLRIIIFIEVLSFIFTITLASAQTEELTLRMSRDFGYGGFNNDIQGLFSMKVTGPDDLVKVVFFIDSSSIGEITQAPFNLQFNTDNYPLGLHDLSAVGYSLSGQEYHSNIISSNFVPASEGNKAVLQIVVPLLIIVFGAIILSVVVPLVKGRSNAQLPLGAERKYRFGGGICPKCHRPFALPLFSMNLGLTKLSRCPYCGKWSAVHIQPFAKLKEAEKAELEWGRAEMQESNEEERIRKELDDSKYLGS